MEPAKKKLKKNKILEYQEEKESIKNLILNFNKEMMKKLDAIEKQVDFLSGNYDVLEHKVETLSSAVANQCATIRTTVPNREHLFSEEGAVPISSKVTFITLNKEEDYLDGSWLGDPFNSQCRVRCHISPTDMIHIHSTCLTAEKMALTLLDYLFDRETQACSNISGVGKHKKKQLNPLFIYGMKCHLKFHFDISEQDWDRIKQNLDSKCRSAFKRKIQGLPLLAKACLKNLPNQGNANSKMLSLDIDPQNLIENHDLKHHELNSPSNEVNLLERAITEAKGNFQILHATPEEVAEIQHTHSIQIFSSEENLVTLPKHAQHSETSSPIYSSYEDNT